MPGATSRRLDRCSPRQRTLVLAARIRNTHHHNNVTRQVVNHVITDGLCKPIFHGQLLLGPGLFRFQHQRRLLHQGNWKYVQGGKGPQAIGTKKRSRRLQVARHGLFDGIGIGDIDPRLAVRRGPPRLCARLPKFQPNTVQSDRQVVQGLQAGVCGTALPFGDFSWPGRRCGSAAAAVSSLPLSGFSPKKRPMSNTLIFGTFSIPVRPARSWRRVKAMRPCFLLWVEGKKRRSTMLHRFGLCCYRRIFSWRDDGPSPFASIRSWI